MPGANIVESEITTASQARRAFSRSRNASRLLAAHFLLALGEHDHVHRQRAARGEVRLERLDVQIELSLVVHAAARVDACRRGRWARRRARSTAPAAPAAARRSARRPAASARPAGAWRHSPSTIGCPGVGTISAREADARQRLGHELRGRAAVGLVLRPRADAAGCAGSRTARPARGRMVVTPGGEIGGNRWIGHGECVCRGREMADQPRGVMKRWPTARPARTARTPVSTLATTYSTARARATLLHERHELRAEGARRS